MPKRRRLHLAELFGLSVILLAVYSWLISTGAPAPILVGIAALFVWPLVGIAYSLGVSEWYRRACDDAHRAIDLTKPVEG